MDAFVEVQKAGALFSDLRCPWFICGGWAIDLFLNRVTRSHKDVDVAIARDDQFEVREYLQQRGWKLEKAVDGRLTPWANDEWLSLPIHTIWCRNDEYNPDFIEILLNEIEDDQFRFRRDQSIVLPRERMFFQTAFGLPTFAPEIVLLYKSNCPEEHESDFRSVIDSLAAESRIWLKASLEKLYKQHPWTKSL